jgi:hypothetical protein
VAKNSAACLMSATLPRRPAAPWRHSVHVFPAHFNEAFGDDAARQNRVDGDLLLVPSSIAQSVKIRLGGLLAP